MSRVLTILLALLLSACATRLTPEERTLAADRLALQKHWVSETMVSNGLPIVMYAPAHPPHDENLTLFIEGDGFAWVTGTQPSADPTPYDPVALRLALAHPDGNVAYIGRPCQYQSARSAACSNRYWTSARFAPEVIAASNAAAEALKVRFGASRLTLVGYSGGAAVAALIAADRDDVSRLVTVAGNLDHASWTAHHRVSPLSNSLNPADRVADLENIRQSHLVGEDDRIIPLAIVKRFAARFPASARPAIQVVPGANHHCCWVEQWPTLWRGLSAE